MEGMTSWRTWAVGAAMALGLMALAHGLLVLVAVL